MDLATIIGVAVSTILVVSAILLGGEPIIFFDVSSALIVVGGTIGATLIRNRLSTVLGTLGVVRNAFATKIPPPDEFIAVPIAPNKTPADRATNRRVEFVFLAGDAAQARDTPPPAQAVLPGGPR